MPPAAEAVMQDYFLLSWSCLFLFINAPLETPFPTNALKTDYGIPLQEGEAALKRKLLQNWDCKMFDVKLLAVSRYFPVLKRICRKVKPPETSAAKKNGECMCSRVQMQSTFGC